MPVFIGIAGPMRGGKDTFAAELKRLLLRCTQSYVCRIALADALKEEVAEFLSVKLADSPLASENAFSNYSLVYSALHSDKAEEKEPYRLLMQWWGTEFRRHWYGGDYWVMRLAARARERKNDFASQRHTFILVPDVRFPNEADFIKKNGYLVRLHRGSAIGSQHISEAALAHWSGYPDFEYRNDGTLEELHEAAARFAGYVIEAESFDAR